MPATRPARGVAYRRRQGIICLPPFLRQSGITFESADVQDPHLRRAPAQLLRAMPKAELHITSRACWSLS